jgi:hypothetical protein
VISLRRHLPDRRTRRAVLLLWACAALLWQGFLMPRHALAMATGIEVCSAAGPVRVDASGHPVDGAALHEHDGCCCCAAPLATPPAAPALPRLRLPNPAPVAPIVAAGPSIDWPAPLARGPPARA